MLGEADFADPPILDYSQRPAKTDQYGDEQPRK